MDRRTPSDYQPRIDNIHFIDEPTATIYQPHVYEFVKYLAATSKIERIIDIGCGSGEKLRGLDSRYEITCIDAEPMREFVRQNLPRAQFHHFDLETGAPALDPAALNNSIVVCSDVVEHLREPEHLIRSIAKMAQIASFAIISTPDRVRARGLLDMGPPGNPAHTMEWTADELGRFMVDCGFPRGFTIGYTLNNDRDLSKSTILAVAGKHAAFTKSASAKSISAVVRVKDEADVLPFVARSLAQQGIDVHIIDYDSKDSSFEIANFLVEQGTCSKALRFPGTKSQSRDAVDFSMFVDTYVSSLNSDWVIRCDADELLHSPWAGVDLNEAIAFVDQQGYDAIGSVELNFRITDSKYSVNFFADDYKFYEFERNPADMGKIIARRKIGNSDNNTETPPEKLFPLKFLSRRYPIRANHQANRFLTDGDQDSGDIPLHFETTENYSYRAPWRRFELLNFDFNVFYAENLVERLSGIGIETEERAIPNIATRFHRDETAVKERAKAAADIAQIAQQLSNAERARESSKEIAEGLSQENAQIRTENIKLQAHLDEIARSRGWKLITAIREVRAKIGI